MKITERIKLELQNPRSFLVLILSLMIVGMFGVLVFETPTAKISGRVTGVDENGNIVLSNAKIDGKFADNEYVGYFVVLKVKYIRASIKGYKRVMPQNSQPFENFRLPENFGDGE